jgi:hypothetical protein
MDQNGSKEQKNGSKEHTKTDKKWIKNLARFPANSANRAGLAGLGSARCFTTRTP